MLLRVRRKEEKEENETDNTGVSEVRVCDGKFDK